MFSTNNQRALTDLPHFFLPVGVGHVANDGRDRLSFGTSLVVAVVVTVLRRYGVDTKLLTKIT